jgi:sensor histidine kinase YesM
MNTFQRVRSKKTIFFIITGFLVLLSAFRILWVYTFQPTELTFESPGRLDISEWDLIEDGTISLNGEWGFIPGEFANMERIESLESQGETHTIPVPEDWQESFELDDSPFPFGHGTYYLHITLPENHNELLGIKFSGLQTAASIYVNDELVRTFGQAGKTEETSEAAFGPTTEVFHTEDAEITLMVHLSNYQSPLNGGILDPITFGDGETITDESRLSRVLQLLIAAMYLLHAVYGFFLYFLGKRRYGKEIFYFGIMLVLHGITILIDDDVVLQLPVSYAVYNRLLFSLFVATLFGNVLFIKHLFRINTRGYKRLLVLFAATLLVVLFLPAEWYVPGGVLGISLYIAAFIFLYYHIISITSAGYPDGLLILIFISAYTSNMIWGFFINMNLLTIPFYPFDFIITIAAIVILLLRRHIRLSELNDRQTEKLRQMDKTRDEFLARTSHELRNPLHGIINIAESVLEQEKDVIQKKNRDNLQLVVHIGKRMGYTLNDLNTITQLREDKIKLSKSPADLHATVNLVLEMLEFMKEGKDIELKSHVALDFPKLWADENRLFQILFNLLHNAIKFTEAGTIEVKAQLQDNQAIIYVSDTGVGIDSSMMEDIFHPYEQNEAASYAHGGIGIGLSVSKQLVELHNGKITFTSDNDGTTFIFTMPVQEKSEAGTVRKPLQKDKHKQRTERLKEQKPEKDYTEAHKGEERGRILIVDDDPVNLRVMAQLLEADYQVDTSLDPEAVLVNTDLHQTDLVITDIMMPKMSGYQFTQKLRERYSLFELPILHVTARSTPEDIKISFKTGANDYLVKPIHAIELKVRVRALTNIKHYVRESQKYEAAWLQAQIQPHFLFNTLNTIASLAEVDPEMMTDTLHAFGTYLQQSFSVMNLEPTIPVKHAIKLSDAYIQIEKARFGDRLRIIKDIDEDIDIQIPPLTIQPLIENAINHGILKKQEGGTVIWRMKRQDDAVQITISDDGAGMTEEKINEILTIRPTIDERVGVKNTNRRLLHLYNEGLSIESTPGEGTIVSFRVPLVNEL